MRVFSAFAVCLTISMVSVSASDRSPSVLSEPEPNQVFPAGTSSDDPFIEHFRPLLEFYGSEAEHLPGCDGVPMRHVIARPIRIIGHLMAAPATELFVSEGTTGRSGPNHPDEIQLHFRLLADLLTECGLSDESSAILDLQNRFQRDCYPRLLISHKEAQLRTLQAEIDRLRKQLDESSLNDVVESMPVELRMNLVKLDRDARRRICIELDSVNDGNNRENVVVLGSHPDLVQKIVELKQDGIEELLHRVGQRGGISFLSRPRIRTHDRQEAVVEIAGSAKYRTYDSTDVSVNPGVSVKVHPVVASPSKLRLGLVIETIGQLVADDENQNSEAGRQRIETVVEIEQGSALAIVGATQQGDDENCLFVTIQHILPAATAGIGVKSPRPASIPRITYRPRMDSPNAPIY